MKQNKVKGVRGYASVIFGDIHKISRERADLISFSKDIPSIAKLTNFKIIKVLISPLPTKASKRLLSKKK